MDSKKKFKPNPDLKLMDQLKEVLRYHHYAYRTEQTYRGWIVRFLKFYGMKRHPKDMGTVCGNRFGVRRQGDRRDCAFVLQHANTGSESGVARRLPPHSKFLQLCNASVGKRGQHPDGAGFDGACGCKDDGDLYACDEQGSGCGEESAGSALTRENAGSRSCAWREGFQPFPPYNLPVGMGRWQRGLCRSSQ